jgi:hypothetical protein
MKRTGIMVVLAFVAMLPAACGRSTKDMTGKVVEVAGSYAKTCRNVASVDGALTAECMDAHSQFHKTTVVSAACRGDIANMNGVLTCTQ